MCYYTSKNNLFSVTHDSVVGVNLEGMCSKLGGPIVNFCCAIRVGPTTIGRL